MILSLCLIITSLLAVELRDLTKAVRAYLGQALLLVAILVAYALTMPNHELLLWAATILVSKGIIIPWLLNHFGRSVSKQEVNPLMGFGPSFAGGVIVVGLFYWFSYRYYSFIMPLESVAGEPFHTNFAVAAAVFGLGLYTLLTRRDAVKAVIGLCLLENGVHMSLVSLAPTVPETAMIGVATDVVISVGMLLYIVSGIYKKSSSTDTWTLSKLRG
jgi:hydrogenase-4 component E